MRITDFVVLCVVAPIILTIFPYFLVAQNDTTIHYAYELPAACGNNQIVSHFAYTLSYNEQHEQADWVAYLLTRERVSNKITSRSDNFRPDPFVKTGSAELIDYKSVDDNGTHYDRGHLAPAADMAWDNKAMSESFFLSNMSPQTAGFNRGIWKNLEELLRAWALEYDTLFVATGPVLTSALPKLGVNKVSIPEYYYKVILRLSENDTLAIGFILPNASSKAQLSSFAVTIDSVETFTGIDFFPALPDEFEEKVESNLCVPCWSWEKTVSTSSAEKKTNENGPERRKSSVQCSAMTQAGTRCKRQTYSPNGKCAQHGGD
ncbi:MAG: DNA/RNA non-specific endonuclease [Bacteroidales bacterium]|nr:DNA/RNA non-specific endonuclease [Bacteroidales bacterium]